MILKQVFTGPDGNPHNYTGYVLTIGVPSGTDADSDALLLLGTLVCTLFPGLELVTCPTSALEHQVGVSPRPEVSSELGELVELIQRALLRYTGFLRARGEEQAERRAEHVRGLLTDVLELKRGGKLGKPN